MIIACPACSTRYVVPDSAIGVDGRTVRCAKCKHSWFQEGPALELRPETEVREEPAPPPPPPVREPVREPEPVAAPPPAPEPQPKPPPVYTEDARPGFEERMLPDEIAAAEARETPEPEPEVSPDVSGDEDAPPVPPAFSDPVTPPPSMAEPEPPAVEEGYEEEDYEYSQFDHEPPFRGRRNMLRLWTIAAVVFALFAVGTVVAVSYWGLPEWVPVERPEFGPEQPNLSFDFPADEQDRRQLSSGTEYFFANGRVTNTGREARRVPTLLLKLRDERNRVVFESEINAPKRVLAPGETVEIHSAMADVPKAAKFAEIGWKPS